MSAQLAQLLFKNVSMEALQQPPVNAGPRGQLSLHRSAGQLNQTHAQQEATSAPFGNCPSAGPQSTPGMEGS